MATGALVRNPDNAAGTYSYSSQPRTIQQQQKYRDPGPTRPCNIMYDKRVVRGNTYALHTLPASSQPNPVELQKEQESRRRILAHKRAREQMRIRSPPPIEGRRHTDVQTELYLEEITDRIEEADVHTQTDAFLDRPPTPLFIPAKTGLDVATQIEEGDLFDFDLEVQPILEVLVGKTVEQSLLEVMEEEELAALREQQRVFEGNRNAELVETQRLEEQERRRKEEKERRMQQQREALMKEKETAEKVAARAFAHGYLSDLVPAVFSNLSNNGFFYDPIKRNIETSFMPWLMGETQKLLDKKLAARNLLDALIRQVVRKKLGISTPIATPDEREDDKKTDKLEEKEGEIKPAEEKSAEEGEKPAEEKPAEEGEKLAEEKPAEEGEKSAEEKPAEEREKSAEVKPAEEGEKPAEEKPAEEGEKLAEEKPAEEGEKPAEEKPAEEGEKPAEEKPAEEEEKPAEEGEKPAEEKPAEEGEKPAEEKPAEEGGKPTEDSAEDDSGSTAKKLTRQDEVKEESSSVEET